MIIDLPRIRNQFGSLGETYASAEPFPHVSLTGVFDPHTLREINAEFPVTAHRVGVFLAKFKVGNSPNPTGENSVPEPKNS